MNILTDYHHRDLYFSNHLLLEKRLGFNLYRPIGTEWAGEGWWTIHTACAIGTDQTVVGQFLEPGIGDNPLDDQSFQEGDMWNIHNGTHDYIQKCITIQMFKDMKFDIIMPSHWCHYELWEALRKKYQPQAVMVAHVGNVDRKNEVEHVIRSVPFPGKCKKQVLIHQELNQDIYKCTPINSETRNITSVTNGYMGSIEYEKYKKNLPEFDFKYYGINCPEGMLHGTDQVSSKMQEANLGWSTKGWGGLGHSNMGWMYSGRGIITNMSQHRLYGECALDLFEPGATCIDIEDGTESEVSEKIRVAMNPMITQFLGDNAKKRFHEVVNYESEAESAKQFFSEIL